MENSQQSPLSTELIREWIVAAHGHINRVQQLVELEPALVRATINWGGGDWESGLGAAAHTGNREIALFLLSKGAPMDIFTAAMLGELEIVKSMIDRYPEMLFATGAHGIPLLRHAEIGGEQANSVVEFLEKEVIRT